MIRGFLMLLAVMSTSVQYTAPVEKKLLTMDPVVIDRSPYPEKGDLYVFLDAMALRESNNRADVVNRYGYMGKYQFGDRTLTSLGRTYRVPRPMFLGNAELQDSAMVEYLRRNREFLHDVIVQYDGKWYRGMYVTESGILAGAHLIGPIGMLAYFNPRFSIRVNDSTRIRPKLHDGNGTQVGEYIKEFSGYSLVMLH